jgi:hypothetical protein
MNHDLKYYANALEEWGFVERIKSGINRETLQLSLLASLETITSDIGTQYSVYIYIIDAAGAEFNSLPPSFANVSCLLLVNIQA